MNSVTLVGRAGRDPEVKYLESGSVVANLTLAVNRPVKDETDWFNLEIWGKQAEVAANYVRKGSLIGIIGSIQIQQWTDRTTGEKKSKPVIRVDRLQLLGSKRDNGDGQSSDGQSSETPPAAAPTTAKLAAPAVWATNDAGSASDEEIPF
jgi:single-strand DNA-binding protein